MSPMLKHVRACDHQHGVSHYSWSYYVVTCTCCVSLIQEHRKSFLAQIAAVTNMSKDEVTDLVETAVAGEVMRSL